MSHVCPGFAAVAAAMTLSGVSTALAASESRVIEEIVVTAQKREESQQDVPIAITTFTETMIEELGTSDLVGLDGIAPNVVIQTYGLIPNVPTFSIRGMSQSEPDANVDPKISTVIDGVYVPYMAGALLDLFDVERIEVLRGPQGTLFGKNNLAGTISITTARPTGELGGRARVVLGENGLQHYQARIDSPKFANETLAAKLSLSRRTYDGYSTNVTTGSTLGEEDVTAGRLSFGYDAGGAFDAALIVDYTDEEILGPAGHSTGVPEIQGDVYDVALSFDPFIDTESTGVTFEGNWSVGGGSVALVAGNRDLEFYNHGDFDSLPNDPGVDVIRDFDGDYQSLELRYLSSVGGRFDYVAGLYYLQTDWRQNNDVTVNPVVRSYGVNQEETASYAAFAQANYHVSDTLTLTAGGRYTRDEKDYDYSGQTYVLGNVVADFSAELDDTWSNFSPRIAVEYRPADDLMLYASVSEGYKGGGYNSRASTLANLGPYDEETVTAYEVGFKSDLLDRRLRLNGAIFLNDFDDLQALVQRPGAARPEYITDNIARVETAGAEIEALWLATTRLRIGLNLGYLHSEYKEFCDDVDGPSPEPFASDCGGPVTPVMVEGTLQYLVAEDQTDLDLANAPELTGSLLVDYDIPVGGGLVTLHGDLRYTDDYNTWGRDNAQALVRDAVTLVNAFVAFQSADGRYGARLYGRNLTDKEVMSAGVLTTSIPITQFYMPPREFGVELTAQF